MRSRQSPQHDACSCDLEAPNVCRSAARPFTRQDNKPAAYAEADSVRGRVGCSGRVGRLVPTGVAREWEWCDKEIGTLSKLRFWLKPIDAPGQRSRTRYFDRSSPLP